MMLVRSTILMPSSAPGIVLSCAGRGGETAIALTWRHAVGDCDAKLGGIMRSAHEIFEDAMYQVYGQTETLPVAMTATRPQFAKDVPTRTTSWRHRTARCERLPQARPSRRHDDPKRGETSCVVICVKPEAAVTEKELVEFCFVHLGNCKRTGQGLLRHDPLPKTPVGKIKRKELRAPFWVGRERRVAGN